MHSRLLTALFVFVVVSGCDKKDDDVVNPISNYPQIIKFDDEGGGELEDDDNFSVTLTLSDRVDPSGEELSGKIIPLAQPVTVNFEIADVEGFTAIADFIKAWKAFYEIDDCTESDDLPMTFDPASGAGTVEFPAGVEEVEIEFEIDAALFDDDEINEERSFEVKLTGVSSTSGVVVNNGTSFKYEVLDDETIQGDWELDVSDAAQFAAFISLMEIVNPDLTGLNADDVDKIEISIEYDEVTAVIELKETEMVTECGETEEVNKVIEVEFDIEEMERNTAEGDIELEGEGDDGVFVYEGAYKVDGSTLELTLAGEYGDQSTDDITLMLSK